MIALRYWYLAGWLLILLLAAIWIAGSLQVNSDLSQFLPQDNSLHNRLLKKAIGSSPTTGTLMLSLQGSSPTVLAKVNKRLAAKLRARAKQEHTLIEEVLNGELKFSQKHKAFVLRYHWLLNPNLSEQTFTTAHMRQKMSDLLQAMQSPVPLYDKSTVTVDPLASIKELVSSWFDQARPGRYRGVWFSQDKSLSLIFVQSKSSGVNINASQALIKTIQSDFEKIQTEFPDVKLVMSGVGYYAVVIRDKIRSDITRLSIAAGLFVCFLLFYVYRGFAPMLFGIMPLLTAIIAGTIAVMLVFGQIFGITMAFGITLIGVTIDYPIHFFTHIHKSSTPKKAIVGIWPTLRLGVLTTIVGFTAMLLAGFEGLKQLAVFAIIGLLAAALVTRWLLPIVISETQKFNMPAHLLRFSNRSIQLLGKTPWLVALVSLITLAWIISQDNLTDYDVKKLTPLTASQKQTDRRLRDIIGTTNTRHVIVINANNVEQALQRSEALTAQLNLLVNDKVIGGYDMAARYLPSLKTQGQRLALIPQRAELEARFKMALQGLPFRYQSFSGFIDSLEAVKQQPLLDYQSALRSPLQWKVETLLHQHETGWMALVLLRRVKDYPALLSWGSKQHVDGMKLLDLRQESTDAMATYVNEAIRLLAWGTVIILTILLIGLRSIKDTLRVVLPIAAALILTIGFWLLSGVKLNMFHLISLLLVVGIGLDYVLFFIRKTSSEDHRLDFLAVWICNITTVVVFGLLFFSFPLVLQAVGGTVAVGALAAFIASASVAEKVNGEKSES